MNFVDDARSSVLKFLTLTVTTQPQPVAGVIGGTAAFSADFFPSGSSYRWQIQLEGSSGAWGNLVETTGFYEGVATKNLTVKNIDNFLADQPSCNFRCVAFNQSIPTFTLGGALTVARHLNWRATPFATAFTDIEPGGVCEPQDGWPQVPIIPTGFSGPYTYLWEFVSGDAGVLCTNPTASRPLFSITYNGTPGARAAFYTCTVSNGSVTIKSDPLAIVGYFLPVVDEDHEDARTVPTDPITGNINGGVFAPSSDFEPLLFVGPWAVSSTLIQRGGSIVSPTFDPLVCPTFVSLAGGTNAGSCVSFVLFAPIFEQQPVTPKYTVAAGAAVWGLRL